MAVVASIKKEASVLAPLHATTSYRPPEEHKLTTHQRHTLDGSYMNESPVASPSDSYTVLATAIMS